MNIKENSKVEKPWGYYTDYFRCNTMVIKEIVIAPGQKISHQQHYDRKEYWQVVSGEGLLSLNGDIKQIRAGDGFLVEKEDWHQVKATSLEPLFCIEVQVGVECSEDDIIKTYDAI